MNTDFVRCSKTNRKIVKTARKTDGQIINKLDTVTRKFIHFSSCLLDNSSPQNLCTQLSILVFSDV